MAGLLGEPQHRVLHDVERGLLVAYGEDRLLECAPLDALQKRRKLATRCQVTLCRGGVVRAMLPSWFLRFFARHGPRQGQRSFRRRDRRPLSPGGGGGVRLWLSGGRGSL